MKIVLRSFSRLFFGFDTIKLMSKHLFRVTKPNYYFFFFFLKYMNVHWIVIGLATK